MNIKHFKLTNNFDLIKFYHLLMFLFLGKAIIPVKFLIAFWKQKWNETLIKFWKSQNEIGSVSKKKKKRQNEIGWWGANTCTSKTVYGETTTTSKRVNIHYLK